MSRAAGLQWYLQRIVLWNHASLKHAFYIALDAQATFIDITFDAEKYYICVQDNGNGIRSDILPRLAQRHGEWGKEIMHELGLIVILFSDIQMS